MDAGFASNIYKTLRARNISLSLRPDEIVWSICLRLIKTQSALFSDTRASPSLAPFSPFSRLSLSSKWPEREARNQISRRQRGRRRAASYTKME